MSKPADPRPAQRDFAYHELRERLILQQIPEGQRLSEPGWARELGVSRTAVREVLARLEAERLIDRGPTTGYVAPTLTPRDVREVLDVRVALEAAAIDRACELDRTDDDALAPLHEAIDQQRGFIDEGYRLGASEADRRFHRRLVELGDNRRLLDMYDRAPLPLVHRLILPPGTISTRPVEEHADIVKAIARGNADEARGLLRQHLQAALADVPQPASSTSSRPV